MSEQLIEYMESVLGIIGRVYIETEFTQKSWMIQHSPRFTKMLAVTFGRLIKLKNLLQKVKNNLLLACNLQPITLDSFYDNNTKKR